MLGDISSAVNIYIITGYADMGKSIDELCTIILNQLKEEPDGRFTYFFCGIRCNRIEVLLRESYGLVLLYKRLDVIQGKYRWPRTSVLTTLYSDQFCHHYLPPYDILKRNGSG